MYTKGVLYFTQLEVGDELMVKRLQHLPTQLLHAIGAAIGTSWDLHTTKEIDIDSDIDVDSAWRRFKKFIAGRVEHMGMPSSLVPGRLPIQQTGDGVAKIMARSFMKLFSSPWFFSCRAECGESWTDHVQDCLHCQIRLVRVLDVAMRKVAEIQGDDEYFYEELLDDLQHRVDLKHLMAERRQRRSTDPPLTPEEARA